MKKLLFIIALLISVQQNLFSQVPTTGQLLRWNSNAWTPADPNLAGHIIREEGVDMTQRSGLNFVGSSATAIDDAANNETEIVFDSDLNALASNSTNGILVKTGAGTVASRAITFIGTAGILLIRGDGVGGDPAFSLANDLQAVENLNGTGFYSRIGTDIWAARTITGAAAGISVTNGDGVAGNPTLTLTNDLNAVESLSGTGLAVRTATDTWVNRTLTGTATITVTNGNGVSGNPTISLAQQGATTGQVLQWNGSAWLPVTVSSESTSVGAFNNTGNSSGLSLTGTALSIHGATISTPGGISTTQQTITAGTGTKRVTSDNGVQLDVDDELGSKSAGMRYTELDGANVMAQTTVSSPDADHGTIVTKVEDGAATLVTYQEIGSLDDKRGIYEGGGLYEDVKSVTATTYTVLYGDRNLHLDATDMVVTLQVIGTGAGETKSGRVIYFFNDNSTTVTINGASGQDIIDTGTLVLSANSGVTLIASGTKWIVRD